MASEEITWTDSPTTLPPCNRYISTHSPDGKPIVHSTPPQIYRSVPGFAGVARSYAVASVPAVLKNDEDVQKYLSDDAAAEPTSHRATDIVVPNMTGANLLIVDIEPAGVSVMHQTVSIDFSICVLGNIDMELQNGDVIHLKPGVSFPRVIGSLYCNYSCQVLVAWSGFGQVKPAPAMPQCLR
jgi:hypothetical protein